MSSERAAYLAIVLSVIMALLSRMTWVYVWALDGFLSIGSFGPGRIAARDIRNLTDSDGDTVLIIAVVCASLAFVSLSGPPIRRMCGGALSIAAGLAATIALTDIAQAWRGRMDFGVHGPIGGSFEIGTPLLATAVIALILTGLGALIAFAPEESTTTNGQEEGALQW